MINLFSIASGIEVPSETPSIMSFVDWASFEEYLQFLEDEKRMKEWEQKFGDCDE